MFNVLLTVYIIYIYIHKNVRWSYYLFIYKHVLQCIAYSPIIKNACIMDNTLAIQLSVRYTVALNSILVSTLAEMGSIPKYSLINENKIGLRQCINN